MHILKRRKYIEVLGLLYIKTKENRFSVYLFLIFIVGSVDCTLHRDLCNRFNIRQYPTTVLYNQSVPHEYMGYHTASEIVDFVKDTLNPAGKKLSIDSLFK